MTVSAAINVTPDFSSGSVASQLSFFWQDPRPVIPAEFMADGTAATMQSLTVTTSDFEFALIGDNDLTDAWNESPDALVFVRGATAAATERIKIAGPQHPSNTFDDVDDAEPYYWGPENAAAIAAWFQAGKDAGDTFWLILSDEDNTLTGDLDSEDLDVTVGFSEAIGANYAVRGGTDGGFSLEATLSDVFGALDLVGSAGTIDPVQVTLKPEIGGFYGLCGSVTPFRVRAGLPEGFYWTDPIVRQEESARAAGTIARVGWLFQVQGNDGNTYRFCSGIDEIELLGHTWQPTGEIVSVSPVEATSELDTGSARIVVDLAGDKTLRIAFLQDLGPAPAVVYWIVDAGAGWRVRNFQAHGRLSAPKLGIDGKVTFEIGTLVSLLDRRINHTWSHDDQRRRDPDDDGLEYMAGLASNLYRDDWPPIRS